MSVPEGKTYSRRVYLKAPIGYTGSHKKAWTSSYFDIYWSDTELPQKNYSNFHVKIYFTPAITIKSTNSTLLTIQFDDRPINNYTVRVNTPAKKRRLLLDKTIPVYRFNHEGTRKTTFKFTAKSDNIMYCDRNFVNLYGKYAYSTTMILHQLDFEGAKLTLSSNSIALGDSITMNISSGFTSYVSVEGYMKSSSGATALLFPKTNISPNSHISKTVTPDVTFLKQAILGPSGYVSVFLKSYYRGDQVLDQTNPLSLEVDMGNVENSSEAGTITITPVGSDIVTDKFIQGVNKAKIVLSDFQPSEGSEIDRYCIQIGDVDPVIEQSSPEYETEILKETGAINITAWIIDSRGVKSNEATTTLQVIPHELPVVEQVFAYVSNGTEAASDGNRIHVKASWRTTLLGGDADKGVQIKILVKDELSTNSSYETVIDETIQGNTFDRVLTNTYIRPTEHKVGVIITDAYGAASAPYNVPVTLLSDGADLEIECLIDISPNGVALGRPYKDSKKQFQCLPPAYFDNSIYINGNTPITSDARLKNILGDCPDILIELWKDIEPCLYSFKNHPNKTNVGVIAQQIMKVFEKYKLDWHEYNLVIEDNNQYYVNYEFIDMLTFVIVQQQEKRLTILEEKVNKLLG